MFTSTIFDVICYVTPVPSEIYKMYVAGNFLSLVRSAIADCTAHRV